MLCADLPVTCFGPKFLRRFTGFGACSSDRSVTYVDGPPCYLIFHFAWDYLHRATRAVLVKNFPLLRQYAALRQTASCKRDDVIRYLQQPRLHHEIEPPLDPFRTWFMGAALLSFDFNYGDLIRWLDGEYTDNYRNFDELLAAMDEVSSFPTRPGYPPVDYDRAARVLMEGAPLRGNYSCRQRDTFLRLQYDNHPPLRHVLDDVRKKFGKEEARSLHLALPRFVAWFLPGLMISPISWVVRKNKGRIVIDSSTRLRPDDRGAVNDQIPNQGTIGREDECPAVHYGNAFARTLKFLWNLRIDHPNEDILLHVDDIDAAFRRIVYHPDAALGFAYVFEDRLMAPVGEIFGGRNSPSFWCLPAELRAHLADCLDYSTRPFSMESDMSVEPAPPLSTIRTFTPAVRDTINQGIDDAFRDRLHNSMFVDDNVVAAVRSRAIESVRAAVGSAEAVFGNPFDTRRPAVLQPSKWDAILTFVVTYLGLILNSRTLAVSVPPEKVAEIRDLCDEWLADRSIRRTPVQFAKLLGLVRHLSQVMPRGVFCTLPVQHTLNDLLDSAKFRRQEPRSLQRWWRNRAFRVPAHVFPYLRLLRTATESADNWTRPIGLMIPRDPTAVAFSDAAYSGMGGWSPTFRFMWRLTAAQLAELGFPMRRYVAEIDASRAAGTDTLHINTLEFIALIVNLWFCLIELDKAPRKVGGHVLLNRVDNTTAIGLYKTAARSRRADLRNLCFVCECLLATSNAARFAQILCNHLPGKDNVEADAMSRPELFPTVSSAMQRFSRLQTCRGFLVPYALLSSLVKAISSEQIEDGFVNEMTQLLQLEPVSFNPGANDSNSNGGFSKTSRRRRR